MASLKFVKTQLIKAQSLLGYENLSVQNQGSIRELKGASNVKKALTILMNLGLFKNNLDPLIGSDLFSNNSESLVTDTAKINAYITHIEIIKTVLTELVVAFNLFEPDENENSVNITLPDTINDFNKLSKVASEINFAISQPLAISDFNCEASIKGVENGTITINVGFNIQDAAGVVVFISSIIGVALRYRKLKLEGDLLVENIREKKKKNDSISSEAIEEVNKAELKEMIEEEAKILFDKYYKTKVEERQQQLPNLIHSINTLSALFSEGIMITPSINADKETVNQFPTASEIQLLENKIKQLESGKEH